MSRASVTSGRGTLGAVGGCLRIRLELSESQRIQDDAVEMDKPTRGASDEEHGAGTTAEVLDSLPSKGHAKAEEQRVEAAERVAERVESAGERVPYKHLDVEA
jgi:hypothetical protein